MAFFTHRGILTDIGTIQSHSIFNSKSETITSGVGAGTEIMNNIVIGGHTGHSASNSITHQKTILTLSFLKISGEVYSDIIIPKMAMYEILKKGHEVGIIVEGNELLASKNFTSGIKFKKGDRKEFKSDSSYTGLFLAIFFGALLCLINVYFGLLFLGVGVFFTSMAFADKANFNKAIFEENEENLRLAFERIAWDSPPLTPPTNTIKILFNNKTILSLSADTIIGKEQLKDIHPDSSYYDERQFQILKSGSNWIIEHCDGAPLETIVNGTKLTSSLVITDGMIVSVGYSRKLIEKMPIMLKYA